MSLFEFPRMSWFIFGFEFFLFCASGGSDLECGESKDKGGGKGNRVVKQGS